MIHLGNKTFSVERGELIMRVMPRFGRRLIPYRHACPLAALEAVAHCIDEAGANGIDRRDLVTKTGARHTHVAVAMAFLVERGIADESGPRGSVLCSDGSAHIDAMTEYHALAHAQTLKSDQQPGD